VGVRWECVFLEKKKNKVCEGWFGGGRGPPKGEKKKGGGGGGGGWRDLVK